MSLDELSEEAIQVAIRTQALSMQLRDERELLRTITAQCADAACEPAQREAKRQMIECQRDMIATIDTVIAAFEATR